MTKPVEPPPGYHEEPYYTGRGVRGKQPQHGPGRNFDWRHWLHMDRTLWLILLISASPFLWLWLARS